MAPRFDYDRLDGRQFRAELDAAGMTPPTFARIFGVQLKRAEAWAAGTEDIPPWTLPALRMLRIPAAVSAAREAAAEMIRADNLRPELGQYPYRSMRGHHD